MFEQFRPPGLAERLRATTVVPLATFLFSEAYFSLAGLLRRVPATLFWLVVALMLSATMFAVARIALLLSLHRGELRGGVAISWLAAAGLSTLICFWRFLALTLPWL